ncbi:hypothetical protein Q0590_18140 [Rhodocytophaga aerolata]|uniref:NnrS family protein n=1 Tax=Rhodocytophaga aerolata TaxID=455078 RepID=A0ABT8R7Y0_9BACT|nr:hypothetical protein [Rhodocytophaga aerolata]MDO1448200.1 hypothetical protein [Rhodocytophaga aerolata]
MKPAPFLLPIALFSAITGIVTGLFRIGWFEFPAIGASEHGAIMVGSFMGTLISLERVSAFKNNYGFVIPLLSAGSLVAFLTGYAQAGQYLLIAASLGLLVITAIFQKNFIPAQFLIAFSGSVCWLLGNVMLVLWNMYPAAVSWWMAFILLTIVSSRLKASMAMQVSSGKYTILYVLLALYGLSLLMPFHGNGRYLSGIALVFIAPWLLLFDVAHLTGVSKYSGWLVFTGFAWLLFTGVCMLWGEMIGPLYDSTLHSFFIGFLFTTIMAQGPKILPSLLGKTIQPFHPILYLWFALLQASLLLRISANFLNLYTLRQWAGLLNGIAMFSFFLTMGILLAIELRKTKKAHTLTSAKA